MKHCEVRVIVCCYCCYFASYCCYCCWPCCRHHCHSGGTFHQTEGGCSTRHGKGTGDNQANSWMTHLTQEVTCWVQQKSQGGMTRSLLFDCWMGWAMERGVLGESGWRTGRAAVVRWVRCLAVVLGCERIDQGVEEAEGVQGDR